MNMEWVDKQISLKMNVEDVSHTVNAHCYGDLSIHKVGWLWNVTHWPSGRFMWLSSFPKETVSASIERISHLFDDMPNKSNPPGLDDPTYAAWWERVKDAVLFEHTYLAV